MNKTKMKRYVVINNPPGASIYEGSFKVRSKRDLVNDLTPSARERYKKGEIVIREDDGTTREFWRNLTHPSKTNYTRYMNALKHSKSAKNRNIYKKQLQQDLSHKDI